MVADGGQLVVAQALHEGGQATRVEGLRGQGLEPVVVGQRVDEKPRSRGAHLGQVPGRRLDVAPVQVHPELLPGHPEEQEPQQVRRRRTRVVQPGRGQRLAYAGAVLGEVVHDREPRLVPVVQRLHDRLPPRPRQVALPGTSHERGRPALEAIRPVLDLVSVFGVDQPVGRAPEPVRGETHPPRRGRERLDGASPDGGEQEGGVVVAGHEHEPVVAGGREGREGGDLPPVRREHAVETGERFGLATPQSRVVVRARAVARLQQLERVPVQDEVGGLALVRQGGQEPPKIVRPPEVLERRPRAVRPAPLAQMQIAHHDDAARRAARGLGVQRNRRHRDGEHQENQPGNRRLTAPLSDAPTLRAPTPFHSNIVTAEGGCVS